MSCVQPAQPERPGPGASWRGHVAYVCSPRGLLEHVITDWALEGLAKEEKVIYAHAGQDDSARSVLRLVEREIGGPSDRSSRDRGAPEAERSNHPFELVALSELGRSGAPTRLVERALAEGFAGVRVSADPSAAVELFGRSRAEELERSLEELCAERPVSVLCRLDESCCETRPGLLALHPGGIRADSLSVAAVEDTVHLAGEVDLVNEHLLAAVLRAVARSGAVLRLDVSRLRFLSVGGARALVQATDFCRRTGGQVVLLDPGPVVRRVLSACGVEDRFEIESRRGPLHRPGVQ